MRQSYIVISLIEYSVDLLAQSICVDKAELAGRTLTGNYRANLCARSAGLQAFFS